MEEQYLRNRMAEDGDERRKDQSLTTKEDDHGTFKQ